MARPAVSVLDTFNRADGAIGANWSTEPFNNSAVAFVILTNQAVATNNSDMWWNAASFANTNGIAAGATIGSNLAAKQAAGGFNGYFLGLIQQPSPSSNTADGYQVGFRRRSGGTGKDTVTLWKYTNATTFVVTIAETDLATDLAVADTLDLELLTNGTLNCYKNGTVVATANDTTYFHAGESAFVEINVIGAGSDPRSGYDDASGGQLPAAAAADERTLLLMDMGA